MIEARATSQSENAAIGERLVQKDCTANRAPFEDAKPTLSTMRFDGDNTYPDCKQCGNCCRVNALCMTAEDFRAIQRYVEERNVTPIDYGKTRCCFQSAQSTCLIWEARPQVCRLPNCHIPRHRILQMDPSIKVDEDLWLVDMHALFVERVGMKQVPGTCFIS